MTQVEIIAEAVNKHGDRRGFSRLRHGHATAKNETRTYESWQGMKRRCDNPRRPDYPYYGGRGISYCKRWSDFAKFLADMGECTKGLTLDRIKVNGNYHPANCRWATRQQQSENTRAVRLISFNGKKQSITAWERELGFCKVGLTMRLKRGWSVKRALLTPPRKGGIAHG